ncbi:DEAD-domain-containing protein [Rozella allomycis CSF55]|uniref:RNA helicase n=1 Tax=Rozella allomycis (strain CSF55) TaxID=988480 RepID=A0A075ATN8_ROZAC|nr:DNA/RNA helicase, DEAD/DEAH box type domain-containing protein [Rozella allomycis CSF55]RKP20350.1 DEAD-domain-containing protein [Rozella allomycis CSF55]|eukprot:EPZ33646.1 DNA/RNA helicase, DEAD/DEAH box type domain-containing protein [Rozella allomycis CSF55]
MTGRFLYAAILQCAAKVGINWSEYRVYNDFVEAGIPEKLVGYLAKQNITKPTPIQAVGWPVVMEGKNVVGVAETGKTLSFGLPLVLKLEKSRERVAKPQAIVLTPTRELCQQVASVIGPMAASCGFITDMFYGGTSVMMDKRKFEMGVDIVVACPGRIAQLISEGSCDLSKVKMLIVDEADRMLDMVRFDVGMNKGFKPQLDEINEKLPESKQTIMWSATWPKDVRHLAEEYLGRDTTRIVVGSDELMANKRVNQNFHFVSNEEKMKLLIDKLKLYKEEKSIIFCNAKKQCDEVAYELNVKGIKSQAIHGDLSQAKRQTTLEGFRKNSLQVLVATDIAARGLDIPSIKAVFNYDMPLFVDNYIHRIGRTARGTDRTGDSHTFITQKDYGMIKDLINVLQEGGIEVPKELREKALNSMSSSSNRLFKVFNIDRYNRKPTFTQSGFGRSNQGSASKYFGSNRGSYERAQTTGFGRN